MNNFLTWLRQRGGFVHPALDLFAPLGDDRGVVAAADLEEGTVLVTVPHAITIHAPAEHAEVWSYLAQVHPGTSPFLSTVLALLSEMARGSASELLPYLETLPEGCGCLLTWTQDEKKELLGTMIESTGEEPEAVFEREVTPRMAGKPELWPAPYNTLLQFLRAISLVQSRAFHMESNNWLTGAHKEGSALYLIPAIDMINHSTDPALRNTTLHSYNVATSKGREAESAPSTGPFFSMKAEKPIKKGQQVLHTYGDLSDAQLLQTYGFIDCQPSTSGSGSVGALQHNPHNSVLIPWDAVVTACRTALTSACKGDKKELRSFNSAVGSKLSLLTSAGVVEASTVPGPVRQTPPFVITQSQPLPDALLTAMQVLLMAEEDVEELQQEYEQSRKKKKTRKDKQANKGAGAGPSPDDTTAAAAPEPLSLGTALLDEDEAFAQVVALAVMQLADKAIACYPSSFKADEATLQQPAVAERLRLALLVRQGERHVLLALKKKGLQLLMGIEGEEGEGEE